MNKNFEDLLTESKVRYYSSYHRCYKYDNDEQALELYSKQLIRQAIKVIWNAGASPESTLALQRHFDVMN